MDKRLGFARSVILPKMLGAAGAGALLAAGVAWNGIAAGERQYANAYEGSKYYLEMSNGDGGGLILT